MSEANGHFHPYYKVMAWLTFFTVAEIAWAELDHRFWMIFGLAAMAGIKAALVGVYYMHLKYENRVIWMAISFPVVLILVMVLGLSIDAVAPYGDQLHLIK